MAGTPRFVASITLLVLAATVSGGRADLSDVRINEFMASNSSVLADEDGDFSDLLELYNAGATTVDLDGAYLTDNANLPMERHASPSSLRPFRHRSLTLRMESDPGRSPDTSRRRRRAQPIRRRSSSSCSRSSLSLRMASTTPPWTWRCRPPRWAPISATPPTGRYRRKRRARST